MRFTADNFIKNMTSRLGWNGRHVWSYYGLTTGTAWCAGEISYTFAKIGYKGKWYGGKPVFYVPYAQEWMAKNYKTVYDYRGKGSLSNAKRGDIVIFMWSRGSRDHIGAVRKTTGSSSSLLTIEGNTNGGVVANRTRAKANIYAVYRPPYKKDLTKRDRIAKTAKKCSWPMGTPMSKRGYPNGNPKPEYKKALSKAYPNRNSWSTQPSKGASCDVAVGTFIRASGADKKWPRGLDEIEKYTKSKRGRKRWQRLVNPKRSDLKPGDVTYQIFDSGAGHVTVYLGKGRVANAHYYGKSYPVIQKYGNQVRSPGGCRKFYVYRRRV